MALHITVVPLKPALGWNRYRDANPVPTSKLADLLQSLLTNKNKQSLKIRRTVFLNIDLI